MKKKTVIVLACTVVFAVALCGAAMAGFEGRHCPKGKPPCGPHGGKGILPVTRYVHRNLMLQTLSEMTGQPVQTLEAQCKDHRMKSLFEQYKIDRAAFRTAMQAKTSVLLELLEEKGYLTPEQKKYTLEEMQARTRRRELRNQWDKNGA